MGEHVPLLPTPGSGPETVPLDIHRFKSKKKVPRYQKNLLYLIEVILTKRLCIAYLSVLLNVSLNVHVAFVSAHGWMRWLTRTFAPTEIYQFVC